MGTILMSMGAAAGTVVAIDICERVARKAKREIRKMREEKEFRQLMRELDKDRLMKTLGDTTE